MLSLLSKRRKDLIYLLKPGTEIVLTNIGTHLQIFLNTQSWENIVGLRDVTDTFSHNLRRLHAGDILPVQVDRAARQPQQSKYSLHCRRLSGSVGANYNNQFATGDLKGDSVQNVDFPVTARNIG